MRLDCKGEKLEKGKMGVVLVHVNHAGPREMGEEELTMKMIFEKNDSDRSM